MARPNVVRDLLLLVLAACGGGLDAVAYVGFHAFVANMTGNTILLGLALGGAHFKDVAHTGTAIGSFLLGAFVGSLIGSEASEQDRWPRRLLVPFALEIVLLLAFTLCWRLIPAGEERTLLLLAVGSAVMGVQSGITHDVHHSGASTTYMTGTLARSAEFLADTLKFGFRGGLVLNVAAWLTYLAAAVSVGALAARGGNVQLVLAVVTVTVLAVGLAGRPLVQRASAAGG